MSRLQEMRLNMLKRKQEKLKQTQQQTNKNPDPQQVPAPVEEVAKDLKSNNNLDVPKLSPSLAKLQEIRMVLRSNKKLRGPEWREHFQDQQQRKRKKSTEMHAEELMKAADANPIAIRLDFDKITHVTKSNQEVVENQQQYSNAEVLSFQALNQLDLPEDQIKQDKNENPPEEHKEQIQIPAQQKHKEISEQIVPQEKDNNQGEFQKSNMLEEENIIRSDNNEEQAENYPRESQQKDAIAEEKNNIFLPSKAERKISKIFLKELLRTRKLCQQIKLILPISERMRHEKYPSIASMMLDIQLLLGVPQPQRPFSGDHL